MGDEGEGGPSAEGWLELEELARRAKAEGWGPEQTREALQELHPEVGALDETDKPEA